MKLGICVLYLIYVLLRHGKNGILTWIYSVKPCPKVKTLKNGGFFLNSSKDLHENRWAVSPSKNR
jgi:hypothetical protein